MTLCLFIILVVQFGSLKGHLLGNSCLLGEQFVIIVFCLFVIFIYFPFWILKRDLPFDYSSSCSLLFYYFYRTSKAECYISYSKIGQRHIILENWRPISLSNVDYKITTKAIVNLVKKVLPKIIHNGQTGFLKGRYIGDSPII